MATKKTTAARQVGMVVTPEEYRRLAAKTGQKTPITELYPKQTVAISRTEDIIGVGGGKFGGKTHGGIYWLISGNKHTYQCGYHKWRWNAEGVWVPGECDCPYPEYDKDGNRIGVNFTYTVHPKFLGAVIRENTVDLRDSIREAKPIYGKLGGDFREGDKEFHFPSGATIFCGHYQDEDSFTKYAGLNITRFLVEEATHIPNVRQRIAMLRSCCRSVYKDMQAQMMLTFNPGGVSHGDILDMFVEPKDADGNVIPPETTITEEYDANQIYARLGVPKPADVGDKIVSTRVFVFSRLSDNPAALSNQRYLANLMDMPEEEREAYLFGNWKILAGIYFKQYRGAGPYTNEPPEANHVVPFNIAKPRLQPWWWRTMACDWGYGHECAVGWACHDQSRDQLWVTDEMVVSETEPDVVGEEIARRSKPILAGLESPMIVMGLSHDAYGLRQDDRSVAELIARGIGRVLGANMVHVPDLMVDKLKDQMEAQGHSTDTAEADAIFANIRSQQKMGITIKRMRDSRVVGWQLIRTLLRWRQTIPEVKDLFDPNLASQIAYEKGLEAYGAYVKLFQQRREILPKLQIVGEPGICRKCGGDQFKDISAHRVLCRKCDTECSIWELKAAKGTGLGCPRLIEAIPKAIHDPLNPEDVTKKHVKGASDLWDMLRYLCQTFKGQSMPEPFKAYQQRTVAQVLERNPYYDTADLVHVNRRLEDAWATRHAVQSKPIHVIRQGRSARARVKGLLPGPQ
jgi:hypothetical protein